MFYKSCIECVRKHPNGLDDALKKRGLDPKSDFILMEDKKHSDLIHKIQCLKEEKNNLSKAISSFMEKDLLVSKLEQISDELFNLEKEEKLIAFQLESLVNTLGRSLNKARILY